MKWLAPILAFGLLASVASQSQAETKLDCTNPPDTASENQCADIAFQKADSQPNEVWRKVKDWAAQNDQSSDTAGSQDYANTVLAAQRAWLVYREAYCAEAGLPMHGGSGEGPLIGNCRVQITEVRVKSLKGLLE